MGKIRILPDILCHHIAAGEVVERPSAVVKELVENSLDAGSSHIIVSYDQGGIKFISVVDNGEGMDREDALLALERHATSKIKTVEDLNRICSYGFRGEALASIAAVSRLELITKTAEEDLGTRIYAEGGVLKSIEPVGCPVGCSVTVRDLFFNVPARKKFLKSENTEKQHILDQLRRLALSQYRVHFELYEGGKSIWNYPEATDPKERISHVFGLKMSQNLAFFQLGRDGMSVRGYLGDPSLGRPTASSIFLFVNGRPFRDALIQKIIREACRSFVPEGIFPFVVLFLEMPPQDVDVNVHPTKQEVRFRNTGVLLSLMRDALLEGQIQHGKRSPFARETTKIDPNKTCPSPTPSHFKRGTGVKDLFFHNVPQDSPSLSIPQGLESNQNAESFPQLDVVLFEKIEPFNSRQTGNVDFEPSDLTVLGVIDDTYIVCASPSGLVLIDFHAAHERLIYNLLISQTLPLPSQQLLVPFLLHVLPEEIETIETRRSDLLSLGYDVEPFGKDSVAVRAVPAIDIGIRHEDILGELLRTGFGDVQGGRLLERFASTVACHKALRAGTPINQETISWLMNELRLNPHVLTCPHGRPVWINITKQEIAKRFGRSI